MIRVSVVVATYRRQEPLKEALNSLARQTDRDMQVVLVNDNAEESWNAAVKQIAEDFRRENPDMPFVFIQNPRNLGSAATRNAGIAAAEGIYVTFLDDDDVYLPDKVKLQAAFMEAGNYDYSVTDLDLLDEKGQLIDKRVRSYIQDTTQEALQLYHLMYHITGTDTMMFRKTYLDQIGGFAPIDVGDEYYLMQRAISGGGRFGYLPGSQIKAYVHSGEEGLSSGESKIKGENALYEYKKQFFDKLDGKTRRHIKMRHFAVIAFAQVRRKRYAAFFGNAFRSFFCAPLGCIKLLLERKM